MPNTLSVLDRTGDTRIEWDPANAAETAIAKKAFEAAKDKRHLIYKLGADGTRGELLRTFDPHAERIVAVPQTVGG